MKGQKFIPLVVVAAGLLAYHNSFTGGFVSDDFGSIPENPTIRHLWPIWHVLSPPHEGSIAVGGRPLVNVSLAINYALGGYNVWGYHALNLTVHILAGLTLLGVVRRTLLQPRLRGRFGAAADELALATALLWTVHPLQTESVTYIIQRTESIMGLFYLLTLYCFIRGVESVRPRLWHGLSVTACALGMTSKEVMVSAPLMVLLYDRAFVSGSFREVWRRRWPLYLGLSVTWILLGLVLVSAGGFAAASMSAPRTGRSWWQYLATLSAVPLQIRGTERVGLTWWRYLAAQPEVILYYLRLCVWPSPLCLDIGWPIPRTWMSLLPPALVLAILLGAAVWAWKTNPVWGFVGAWFFLILAPSSSFIPIVDVIHEHRMYLPLAAVISLGVMGVYSLLGRHSWSVLVALGIGLGFLTWRRNQDYRSEITIRADAVAKFPNDSVAYYNLGVAWLRLGRLPEAMVQWERAVRIDPDQPEAHNNLAIGLMQQGRLPEAVERFEQALRIAPGMVEVHYNLGIALERTGKLNEAIEHWEQALQIRPDFAQAHQNLGYALLQQGRAEPAARHLELWLQMKPDDAEAYSRLGVALFQMGKIRDAVGQYEHALRIKPDLVGAQNNLAWLLATAATSEGGDPVRAVTLARQACELTDNRTAAYVDTLAAAYAAAGRFNDATVTAQKAIALARSAGQPELVREIEDRLQLYRSGRAYGVPRTVVRSESTDVTGPQNP